MPEGGGGGSGGVLNMIRAASEYENQKKGLSANFDKS